MRASAIHRHNGFSLIELLVVLAIVVVLGSFAFSGLGKLREKGAEARCINNLRQLTVATFNYMGDRNMEYPIHYLNGTTRAEQWYLPLSAKEGPGQVGRYATAYVEHRGYGIKAEPFFCMGNPAFNRDGQLAWTNYSMNRYLCGKRAMSVSPHKVLFLDGNYRVGKKLWYLLPSPDEYDLDLLLPTHGRYSNFAFTDGRIERVFISESDSKPPLVPKEWFNP